MNQHKLIMLHRIQNIIATANQELGTAPAPTKISNFKRQASLIDIKQIVKDSQLSNTSL